MCTVVYAIELSVAGLYLLGVAVFETTLLVLTDMLNDEYIPILHMHFVFTLTCRLAVVLTLFVLHVFSKDSALCRC